MSAPLLDELSVPQSAASNAAELQTAGHSAFEPGNWGVCRLIATDIRAKARWCYGRDDRKSLVKTLFTDGTCAMVLYRLMQWSRRWRLSVFEMFLNKTLAVCCNCIIGRGAEFGAGFVLVHSTGVVINGRVRGGRNIYIEHQVTIGAERRQSPTLGNEIFIGAGAKLIGQVEVGDGARIGANAVVLDDVPAWSTVAGIPARVVKQREVPMPGTPDNVAPSINIH
jgi:serine O-acetyltransferase